MNDILRSKMNKLHKEVLMNTVVHGTYEDVKNSFNEHELVFDESYFDYKLLIAALKRNNREILKYLLYDINCRAVNPNKIKLEETPLHLAMKLNISIIIKELLRKGALLFDKDENGEIPIFVGFKSKSYGAVQALLTNCEHNCELDDLDFMLHFHIACINDYSDIIENYLKCGVNPNSPFSVVFKKYYNSSLNPVQFAAEKNYWLLFERLVYYGGDLSIKNAKGLTSLHIIYYNNSMSIEAKKSRIKCTFEIGNDTKFVNAVNNNGVSHFHMCCMIDKPDFVKKFIDDGANVNSSISLNCPNYPGYTPLHFAVINGCERVVELLLKNGADCNKQDEEGRTPLHLACTTSGCCKAHIVKLLLDYQADPAIKDKRRYTPLHVEFYNADNENQIIFDMLLSKITGEIVNFTSNEGLSYFHIASSTNKINIIKDFLKDGVNIDDCVSFGMCSGYTALHFAVLNNQKDVVELLLERNAQVNIKSKMCKVTPLHLACEFSYAKFCGENANKNIENFEPFPINVDSISNRRNQLDIIRLLLSHGAQVDAKDYQGMTPLLHTCMIDRNYCKLNWSCTSHSSTPKRDLEKEINIRLEEIIKLLLSYKAKVNACTHRQESILHIISKYRSLKITKIFIKSILYEDVDIVAVDDAGLTPLHVAVYAKNKRMVQILLENNANVNVRCKNSRTPLHIVFSTLNPRSLSMSVQMDIIKILLNYGADINIEDALGNTFISPLLKWSDNNERIWLESDLSTVFHTINLHIQKLLALNLHVSEKVQKLRYALHLHCKENGLDNNSGNTLDKLFDFCTKEVERMKLIKINNNTSLYSILLIHDQQELAKYARNKNLIKIVKAKNLHKNFPMYSDILKAKFTRGSMRSNLLQNAKASLKYIFKVSLPYLCWDVVLKNLEIKDYVNLNKVGPTKRDLKRKSNESNLKESEPLTIGNKERKIDDRKFCN